MALFLETQQHTRVMQGTQLAGRLSELARLTVSGVGLCQLVKVSDPPPLRLHYSGLSNLLNNLPSPPPSPHYSC